MNDTYHCDRCGKHAPSSGRLPTDRDTYRFCPGCWNALHRWVQEGGS